MKKLQQDNFVGNKRKDLEAEEEKVKIKKIKKKENEKRRMN